MAVLAIARDEWIVENDLRAVRFEQAHDVECGALADVVDVRLVRDADDEDAAAVHRLSFFVECLRDLGNDVRRHLTIDLAGEIDEARLVVQRPHLPREVMRIERDTETADARPWRELHEAERL